MEKKEKRVLMVANFSRRGKGPAAYVPDLINSIKEIAPEIRIDVLIGAQGAYLTDEEVEANNIYKVLPGRISGLFLKAPKVRVFVWNWIKEKLYKKVVYSKKYDFVVLHSLPTDSNTLVKLAKSAGKKVLLFPWGSDVLRASGRLAKRHNLAFGMADFIRGDSQKFMEDLINKYPSIHPDKYVNLTYASPGISYINKIRGCITKDEMATLLSLPQDRYYIVCGYNAYYGQQHKTIIEKIAEVRNQLPSNYLLLFPITYGHESGISSLNIETWCKGYGLNYHCFTDYLTDQQMACLHLLSDVFIHLQLTDAANSFIMEALCANTKVINGSWLHYPDLEKYGNPFYVCNNLNNLPAVLLDTVKDSTCSPIPNALKKEFENYTWPVVSKAWAEFFDGKN